MKNITARMKAWVRQIRSYEHNFIALGDFTTSTARVTTSTTPSCPQACTCRAGELHDVTRSIFDDPGEKHLRFYDQIAWFGEGRGRDVLTLEYKRAGTFHFKGLALPELAENEKALQWWMSRPSSERAIRQNRNGIDI